MTATKDHPTNGERAAPALQIEGALMEFGSLRAVADVGLTVPRTQRRGIIGPNGAGKTTLFNVIGGQLTPTRGKIALFGRDITMLPPHRRAALGLARTFQITNLFVDLSVLDNLVIALQGRDGGKLNMLRPISSKRHLYEEAERLLERTGLVEERAKPVATLSHGRQRIVELAVALAGRPRVLLLDEPTAGVSVRERENLVRLLEDLDPELTLIVIEHDMDVCFRLVDWITVLHRGSVLADGDRDAVRTNEDVQAIYLGEKW